MKTIRLQNIFSPLLRLGAAVVKAPAVGDVGARISQTLERLEGDCYRRMTNK
jgi:hypothetical protein